MKLFFLLNPSHPQKLGDFRELAAQSARRHGWEARFGPIDCQRPGSLELLLRQAAQEGCPRLAVVGGDGTLHRVINELHRMGSLSSMEIAVVPGGTCNDFARTLGLRRKRFAQALDLACGGKTRPVDLGRSADGLFVNNAGFGRRADAASVRRVKALKTLRNFQPTPLRARWENGELEGSFFMALACNGPFFSGGLFFSKNVRLDDGLLDVFLIPAMPKWKMVSLLLKGRLGSPIASRRLMRLRVRQIEFEAQSDLWPQADGEPSRGAVRRVIYAMASEKAMIVVPAATKSMKFFT